MCYVGGSQIAPVNGPDHKTSYRASADGERGSASVTAVMILTRVP